MNISSKAFASLLYLLMPLWVFAGEMVGVRPVSEPVAVSDGSGVYVGGGLGLFHLRNLSMNERLHAMSGTLLAGYALNCYTALEGRYARGLTRVRYTHAGATRSLSSRYDDLSLYLKLSYPIGRWSPYLLVGYGRSALSDLGGRDREEYGVHYGAGLSWHLDDQTALFGEYTRLYHGHGFGGQAHLDTLTLDALTVGLRYRF